MNDIDTDMRLVVKLKLMRRKRCLTGLVSSGYGMRLRSLHTAGEPGGNWSSRRSWPKICREG